MRITDAATARHSLASRALAPAALLAVLLASTACTSSSDHKLSPSVSKPPPALVRYQHVSPKADRTLEKILPVLGGVAQVAYYPTTQELDVTFKKAATSNERIVAQQQVEKATGTPLTSPSTSVTSPAPTTSTGVTWPTPTTSTHS